MRGSASKNCHISDLKITNCTHPAGECRTGLWKTQWRMLNSTGKTGFAAGLLNFLHRVFNMWKKIGSFYGMYSPLLWKTFRTGKTAGPGRGRRRSSKGQFCKTGPGRWQAAKKSGRADKKAAICWQTRSAYAILYLGLSSDKIVGLAACASGAARPGEHALHRSDRNGRRTQNGREKSAPPSAPCTGRADPE